ncbi:hypothetical protein NIES2119_04770 [[Phormidium ambiguum] IAM M-71]|uniref:Uncharacterized protein n=1 Tax=[Phormidium ambiguum] IAM M-71 TaxID=454136 RepID=A0A1U7IQG7_9CYAN|nr:hypothetical protein [Phormidium ambiguum]OKH39595.1 hypothetical protein NIES2119_04770 [Phormidium ambiguum IAM M-71]
MQKNSLIYLSLLFFCFTQETLAAMTKINQSLLIGEWSQPGKCNQSRFIYTRNGQYISMEKKKGRWQTLYRGIYLTSPQQPDSIIIGDGPNMGGYLVDINELTRNTLKGEWNVNASEGLTFDNPEDAKFSYVRCSGTVLKKN